MNIRGQKYETKTEEEALAWINEQAGKEMRRCVFPTRPCLNYYISRDGLLYGCRYFWRAKKYVAYQCHPKTDRKADGVIYNLFTPDGEANKLAARLIWCTWVLGYWSDKVKVRYKDGDRNNIDLSNLAELNEEWKIRKEHAEEMRKFENIYRREFKMMVHDVQYRSNIRKEEAQDAVQEAFIAITRKHDGNIEHFCANWFVMAQKIAMNYIQQKENFTSLEYESVEKATGRWESSSVTPILAPIKDEKDRRALELVAQGATITEICEEIGISRTNITRRLHRAREICKDYLSTDREIMKIYG